jgi:hypothetical protein
MAKRFANEKEQAPAVPMKVYTDAELRALDAEITKDFSGFKTRKELERFYAHDGAGSVLTGIFHVNPYTIKKTEDKLEQWRRWRFRNYPPARMEAYEGWAEQSGRVAEKKTAGRYYKRSALNAYEKRHGKPFEVPEGYRIEEDEKELIANDF